MKIPAQSPNCNAHAERFVKTVREECLRHFVIFGERHLRYLLKEFLAHYHWERFHQGLGGQLIEARAEGRSREGRLPVPVGPDAEFLLPRGRLTADDDLADTTGGQAVSRSPFRQDRLGLPRQSG